MAGGGSGRAPSEAWLEPLLLSMLEQFPFRILGFHSDNGSEFINHNVETLLNKLLIEQTKSRPRHSNDNGLVESKNGAVIRKMVGYQRLSGIVAGQALAQLPLAVRLYVNYFQPSFKLRERAREGSNVKKFHYPPATPCDQPLAHQSVNESTKDFLRKQREALDPLELLQRIRQGQSALAALRDGESSNGPARESLDKFLAALARVVAPW